MHYTLVNEDIKTNFAIIKKNKMKVINLFQIE